MIYFYVQCDAAGRVIPKNGLTDDVGSSGRRVIDRQRTQSALSLMNLIGPCCFIVIKNTKLDGG